MNPAGTVLAIDTATSVALVATGSLAGALRREATWTAGFRHGEELLGRIAGLLAADGLRREDLAAIVVGTGPGAFTGLRIGLATAKTLAHELGVPIVGISTAVALAHAARSGGAAEGGVAVLLPAGPSGIVVVEPDGAAANGSGPAGTAPGPRLVTGGGDLGLDPARAALAVDLDGRAEPAALTLGGVAHRGLGASLIELGAARLAAGERDDAAQLVPDYVSLPRGVTATTGEVAWSRDRR